MMANPAVMDVAVVGLPHDIDGEHPFAFVVVKTDQIGQPLISVEELIDYTNGKKIVIAKNASVCFYTVQIFNRESCRNRKSQRRYSIH